MSVSRNRGPGRTIIGQFGDIIQRHTVSDWQAEDPWHVDFMNESAIDVGGPRRELFGEIARSIFEESSQMVTQAPNGRNRLGGYRETFVPASQLSSAEKNYYAVGVFLGIIVRTGFVQDLPFAPVVWRMIAGETVGEEDVVQIDDRLRSLFARLRESRTDADFAERFPIHWESENWDGTVVVIRARRLLAAADVDQWIEAVVRLRIASLEKFVSRIRRGFLDNVGIDPTGLTGPALSLMCQGSSIVAAERLIAAVHFVGFAPGSRAPQFFNDAVRRMTNEQRRLLLRFTTGMSRLPNRNAGNISIYVGRQGDDSSRLPGASTCFNKLYLPDYSSAKVMYEKIVYAIETCTTMENS
jgi:ubiquitin-protein ligase E3 A